MENLAILHYNNIVSISLANMKSISFFFIFITLCLSCKENLCKNSSCRNNGTCEAGVCTCPTDFEGPNCDSWSGRKFLGTYTGTYSCSSSPLSTLIEPRPNESHYLTIRNLGDYACAEGDYFVKAKFFGDSLKIEPQLSCSNPSYQFSGKGALKKDTLRLQFSVTYSTNPGLHTDYCIAILPKKY